MTKKELFGSLATFAAAVFLCGCGGETKKLQAENEALRAEVADLRARADADAQAASTRSTELTRLQRDVQDAVRLRGEVTQLRTAARDLEKLRAENQQLKSENQNLRSAAASIATPATPPPAPAAASFPRESWAFAGYTSPEAALISAIWSMQQGNPKQYYDSLTPEEQTRIAATWQNRTEAEIAAKHQADTAPITGLRVVSQQPISDNEIQMNVLIEGVNRPERVTMKRIGNDWKFGGFIRERQ